MSGKPAGGLAAALARLGESSVALVRTRLELAALEFDEERERRRDQILTIAVAVFALGFTLFWLSLFVVVYFWDTHRLSAIAGITLLHVLIGAAALWRLAAQRRAAPRPFATTLAELDHDRQWLSRHLGRE